MIFVTVGTQLAFPRLMQTVAAFAADNPGQTIVAQTGPDATEYAGIECHQTLSMAAMAKRVEQADVVVAHAGMGTILSALAVNTPVIVMPRRVSFGEHRNDHQTATAERLKSLPGLTVAVDAVALRQLLDARAWVRTSAASPTAPAAMIANVSRFIQEGVA